MKLQSLVTFFPLLGCSLLVALLVLRLSERLAVNFRSKIALATLTIGSCFISINQLTIAGYLRGIVADLSITTTVMLIVGCYSSLVRHAAVNATEKEVAGFLLVGGGVFLYPMSLGWSSFDPYQYGYYPTLLGTLLSALILIAFCKEFFLIMTCLLACLLAYSFRLLDSNNLWDYLIDPLAVVYGINILLLYVAKQFSKGQSLEP